MHFTRRRVISLAAASVAGLVLGRPAWADDREAGEGAAGDWSHDWPPEGPTVVWKRSVGFGSAGLAVAGPRLFTIGSHGRNDYVYCLDTKTGKPHWARPYRCAQVRSAFDVGPAVTPVCHGEHVYTFSHDGQLFCWRAEDGGVVWSMEVQRALRGRRPPEGYASRPLVHGSNLIVDIGGVGTSTVALDRLTGRVAWRSGSDPTAYAAPTLAKLDGGRELLLLVKARHLVALDPADGSEKWRYLWNTAHGFNASTPICHGNQVFLTAGYGRGGVLLDVSGEKPDLVWRTDAISPRFSTPVRVGDHLYGTDSSDDGGVKMACVRWRDGKTMWQAEGFSHGQVAVSGDRLLVVNARGELVVFRATEKACTQLARASLLRGRCLAAPLVAAGKACVRGVRGELVCVDVTAD